MVWLTGLLNNITTAGGRYWFTPAWWVGSYPVGRAHLALVILWLIFVVFSKDKFRITVAFAVGILLFTWFIEIVI